MSLGSSAPGGFLRKAIEEATDVGVLCVAAAGNNGGLVDNPAKWEVVVGVSALGRLGAYPKDSLHVEAQSHIMSADHKYFLASFSASITSSAALDK